MIGQMNLPCWQLARVWVRHEIYSEQALPALSTELTFYYYYYYYKICKKKNQYIFGLVYTDQEFVVTKRLLTYTTVEYSFRLTPPSPSFSPPIYYFLRSKNGEIRNNIVQIVRGQQPSVRHYFATRNS